MKKYIQEIAHMKIILHFDYYNKIIDRLDQNLGITPETIGYLIGSARPVMVDVKCRHCKKSILEGTQHVVDPEKAYFEAIRKPVHAVCRLKELKKEGCTCVWDLKEGKANRIDKGICKIHG